MVAKGVIELVFNIVAMDDIIETPMATQEPKIALAVPLYWGNKPMHFAIMLGNNKPQQ